MANHNLKISTKLMQLPKLKSRPRLGDSFIVKPGADANQIKLAYRGAKEVRLNNKGQLEVATPIGSIIDEKPYSYQEKEGRQVEVATEYKLEHQSKAGVQVCGFRVGIYDKSKELVVDPVILVYAGYIGGSGDDQGLGIAVDSAGNAYVTGFTLSTEASFPVAVGPDLTFNGIQDAFVAKVNVAGTGLVYAGYIGGSNPDVGFGIAVDSAGNAYVTGRTSSTEASFPVTVGPDLTFNAGIVDAFVAKIADTSAPPLPSFDICLQDDSSGDFLQINSTTGEYQFTKCGPGGFTLSRTGTVRMRGSVVTLQQNGPDVRVLATITGRRGMASIRVLSSGTTFTITDRDTTNNTCACP